MRLAAFIVVTETLMAGDCRAADCCRQVSAQGDEIPFPFSIMVACPTAGRPGNGRQSGAATAARKVLVTGHNSNASGVRPPGV